MSTASPDAAYAQEVLTACARRVEVAGAQLSVVTPTDRVDVSYGVADATRGRAMTTRSRSQVGSIAKVLTAVLVHQLVDEGHLSLTADVSEVAGTHGGRLDGLAGVEVGQLLSMSSGLDWGLWVGGATVQEALRPQLPLPRRAAPGTSFGYSFASTLVAARLVELVRGRQWWQCVHDHLADPLGLALSTTGRPVSDDDAPGHARGRSGWSLIEAPVLAGMAPTGTTLASCAADLATLTTALCTSDSPLLSAGSREALHRPVVPVGARMVADAWCHGPYARTVRGSVGSPSGAGDTVLHGHGGRWAGGLCDVTWDAATATSVAVVTNTPGRGAALLLAVGRELHRSLWGPAAVLDPVETDPHGLSALEGRYVTANRAYDVAVHDGALAVRASTIEHPEAVFALPGGSTRLRAVGSRRFLPEHEDDDERRLQEFWFSEEEEPAFFYDGFVGARRERASATTAASA